MRGNRARRWDDDRGVADTLDFLTAMVVVIGAVAVYFTAAAVLLDVQSEGGDARAHAGLRATERLADDALRSDVDAPTLSPACTRAFFTGGANRSCGFRASGSGQSRLRAILGLGPRYAVNITVENATGIVRTAPNASRTPFAHAVGDPVPRDGAVTTYYRTVTYGRDADGDGRPEYYTLSLRLWEVA